MTFKRQQQPVIRDDIQVFFLLLRTQIFSQCIQSLEHYDSRGHVQVLRLPSDIMIALTKFTVNLTNNDWHNNLCFDH